MAPAFRHTEFFNRNGLIEPGLDNSGERFSVPFFLISYGKLVLGMSFVYNQVWLIVHFYIPGFCPKAKKETRAFEENGRQNAKIFRFRDKSIQRKPNKVP